MPVLRHSQRPRQRTRDGRRSDTAAPLTQWAAQIRPLVDHGRAFKDAVAEVFAANAQLLALRREQATRRRTKPR